MQAWRRSGGDLDQVRQHTDLRDEQKKVAAFALVPDLDMAGARGAALAARHALRAGTTSPPP